MHTIRAITTGLLLGLAFHATAVDYADHQSICEDVAAARTHAWRIGEKEQFKTTCPCELREAEKLLEPANYRALVDWKLDAKAFALNLPEGFNMGEFMSQVFPLIAKIEKSCG